MGIIDTILALIRGDAKLNSPLCHICDRHLGNPDLSPRDWLCAECAASVCAICHDEMGRAEKRGTGADAELRCPECGTWSPVEQAEPG